MNKRFSLSVSLVLLFATELHAVSIKPFCAVRPSNDLLDRIIYSEADVADHDLATAFSKSEPMSFIHLSQPEVDCLPTTQLYDAVAGIKAFHTLQEFLKQSILIQDNTPCLYLYGRESETQLQIGIVGLVDVRHYGQGAIKQHEEVINQKMQKLTRYTELQKSQVDPVLLMYEQRTEIEEFINNIIAKQLPTQSVQRDGFWHHAWVINQPEDIEKICRMFQQVPTLYIADGHHRSAASYNLHKRKIKQGHISETHDFYMVGLFPFNQVSIKAYNRIIKDLDDKMPSDVLAALAPNFIITPVKTAQDAQPHEPRSFGIYLEQQWYSLKLKEEIAQKFNTLTSLDMEVLDQLLLKPIFKMDIRFPDARVEFVGGRISVESIEKKCQDNDWPLAIVFYPVQSASFSAIVDDGRLMPPKTTWIEPKVKLGLFTYPYSCCIKKKDEA